MKTNLVVTLNILHHNQLAAPITEVGAAAFNAEDVLEDIQVLQLRPQVAPQLSMNTAIEWGILGAYLSHMDAADIKDMFDDDAKGPIAAQLKKFFEWKREHFEEGWYWSEGAEGAMALSVLGRKFSYRKLIDVRRTKDYRPLLTAEAQDAVRRQIHAGPRALMIATEMINVLGEAKAL